MLAQVVKLWSLEVVLLSSSSFDAMLSIPLLFSLFYPHEFIHKIEVCVRKKSEGEPGNKASHHLHAYTQYAWSMHVLPIMHPQTKLAPKGS